VPIDFQYADHLTIGLLVILEGLLSADNALVLAILVLGLPKEQQRKALRYGILGAFAFRILAILAATHLIAFGWVKLVGGGYLMWLTYSHFFLHGSEGGDRRAIKPARPMLGLTALWATVVKVELTDLVFAIDSILVAVAMSSKTWVIITGGVLGIIAMRMVIGQLLAVVRKYPALVDGAFVIIGWVAIKLFVEYAHQAGYIGFQMPKTVSLGVIVVIFGIAYAYARKQGPADVNLDDDAAASLLKEQDEDLDEERVRVQK
jgi:YkoY family integral membrane protein